MRIAAAEDRVVSINEELQFIMEWMSRCRAASSTIISKYIETVSNLLNERTSLIKYCDKAKDSTRFNQTFSLREAEIFVEELDLRAIATSMILGEAESKYFDEARDIRKLSNDIKDKISIIKHSVDI